MSYNEYYSDIAIIYKKMFIFIHDTIDQRSEYI